MGGQGAGHGPGKVMGMLSKTPSMSPMHRCSMQRVALCPSSRLLMLLLTTWTAGASAAWCHVGVKCPTCLMAARSSLCEHQGRLRQASSASAAAQYPLCHLELQRMGAGSALDCLLRCLACAQAQLVSSQPL